MYSYVSWNCCKFSLNQNRITLILYTISKIVSMCDRNWFHWNYLCNDTKFISYIIIGKKITQNTTGNKKMKSFIMVSINTQEKCRLSQTEYLIWTRNWKVVEKNRANEELIQTKQKHCTIFRIIIIESIPWKFRPTIFGGIRNFCLFVYQIEIKQIYLLSLWCCLVC